VPVEQYRGHERPVESYYVTMRLPDSDRAEFILMMPFTPKGRQNMISWLAARCDGEHYGKLVVFMFPKQKLVYGPSQVEARIDQDPDISQQLTLWGQSGSEVTRGNLLVIPVARGLLYVEPLFIQAEAAAVPQLRRVITAYGDRVAMAENLDTSLRALFVERAEPAEAEPGGPPSGPLPTEATDILRQALQHYHAAQEALRNGDWQEYGRRMDQMKAALDRLEEALGVPGEATEQSQPLPWCPQTACRRRPTALHYSVCRPPSGAGWHPTPSAAHPEDTPHAERLSSVGGVWSGR